MNIELSKRIKLVKTLLEVHGLPISSDKAIELWIDAEVVSNNKPISHELFEKEVDTLMYNRTATARLYAIERNEHYDRHRRPNRTN